MTIILFVSQYILLKINNFKYKSTVSFLVFAVRKTERLEKHVYNADLWLTQVMYRPRDLNQSGKLYEITIKIILS